MKNKNKNEKELEILEKRLRRKIFAPGLTRIKSRFLELKREVKKESLEQQKEFISDEMNLDSNTDFFIAKKELFLSKKGYKKLNTDENKELDFDKIDEMFAIYLINGLDEYIKTNKKNTWNVKLYSLIEEFKKTRLNSSLFDLTKLMFAIKKEQEKNHDWLGEAVTDYVKEELINKNGDKTLFKSKNFKIVVSLVNLNISVVHSGKEYVRPYNLEELSLFPHVKELFKN